MSKSDETAPEAGQTQFSKIIPTMAAAMDSAIGSVSQFMELVNLRSTSQTPQETGDAQVGLEDLNDSKFLVGLDGDLDHSGTTSQDLGDSPSHGEAVRITSKQVYLRTTSGAFDPYNIVLFRRRPFIFTLIYETSKQPSDFSAFYTLYKRLVSISEPLYRDVSDETAEEVDYKSKFYYLTIDESQGIVQSSLPLIPRYLRPPELESLGEDRARKAVLERQEIVHIHQHVVELLLGVVTSEQDRFIRTARNWCLFWTRLPQNRQVVFVKKFSRSSAQPALDSTDFLVSLGKDAKHWLDSYKHYGKV
jgi:hypothetical protein